MILMTKIILQCLYHSIRRPRTIIIRAANPRPVEMSPVPWWGSSMILVIGIISWCLAAQFQISGLDEAARAMVYIPLGNIFGMSLSISGRVSKK